MTPGGPGPAERNRRAYDRGAEEFRARTGDRSRIEKHAARFAAAVAPGGRVLDLGCGPGHDRPLLESRRLRVVGADISSSMLALARRDHPGPYVQADVHRPPFRGPFDGIWANASLLHVPRASFPRVVAALADLLAPGGALFVSLKEGVGEGVEPEPAYEGMPPRWFTYWQPEPLDAALRAAGLEVAFGATSPGSGKRWLVRIGLRYSAG